MIPIGFKYNDWLDESSDKLSLKQGAPKEVKDAFDEWITPKHEIFTENKMDTEGIKIEELL